MRRSCIPILCAKGRSETVGILQDEDRKTEKHFNRRRPFHLAVGKSMLQTEAVHRQNHLTCDSTKPDNLNLDRYVSRPCDSDHNDNDYAGLQGMIKYLIKKVESLENEIKSGMVKPEKHKSVSVETQTEFLHYTSYAEAARVGALKQAIKTPEATSGRKMDNMNNESSPTSSIQQNKSSPKVDDCKKSQKDVSPAAGRHSSNTAIRHAAASKKKSSKYDVTSESNKREKDGSGNYVKREQEENDVTDFPRILCVNDSIMKKVNAKRLGKTYGFQADQKKAYTIKDVELIVKKACDSTNLPYDALAIHVGVNDLQKRAPTLCAKDMTECIRNIKKDHPNLKIAISKIAPTSDPALNVKGDLYNALLVSELSEEKKVTFIHHLNLKARQINLRDGLHPTARGASILAKNCGRRLRDLFWEQPRKSAKHHWHLPFSPFPDPWSNRFNYLPDW